MSKDNPALGCIFFIVLIIAIVMCSSSNKDEEENKPITEEDKITVGRMNCQDAVKANALSPSSVRFPDLPKYGKQGNLYTFQGHVDMQNAYGVKVRNLYTCKIILDVGSDTIQLKDLRFD